MKPTKGKERGVQARPVVGLTKQPNQFLIRKWHFCLLSEQRSCTASPKEPFKKWRIAARKRALPGKERENPGKARAGPGKGPSPVMGSTDQEGDQDLIWRLNYFVLVGKCSCKASTLQPFKKWWVLARNRRVQEGNGWVQTWEERRSTQERSGFRKWWRRPRKRKRVYRQGRLQ